MQSEKPPSIASEVQQLQEVEAVLGEIFKHCNKMKTDILHYSRDPATELKGLKEGMETLAELQKQVVGLAAAASKIEDLESDSDDEDEVLKKFDAMVKTCKEEENIDEFAERAIHAVEEYIENSQRTGQSMDEDLLVTETAETLIDPLTKCSIKDLVKSVLCNHKFERESIMKYLDRPKKCPYSGCVKELRRDDIVDDHNFQVDIKDEPEK